MTGPLREGDALPTVEKHITQAQVERYATASGDFNPMHLDHEFAAASHFGRTVAHGMMVAASLSEMMTAAFGADWARAGRLKIRFRNPVFPGERVTAFGTVRTVAEVDGARRVSCSVGVKKPGGEPAITGDAIVTVPSDE